jgi:hypothetical protein
VIATSSGTVRILVFVRRCGPCAHRWPSQRWHPCISGSTGPNRSPRRGCSSLNDVRSSLGAPVRSGASCVRGARSSSGVIVSPLVAPTMRLPMMSASEPPPTLARNNAAILVCPATDQVLRASPPPAWGRGRPVPCAVQPVDLRQRSVGENSDQQHLPQEYTMSSVPYGSQQIPVNQGHGFALPWVEAVVRWCLPATATKSPPNSCSSSA